MRDKYKIIAEQKLTESSKIKDVVKAINELKNFSRSAARAREFDIQDFDNQIAANPVIFSNTPTSSSDLIGTEKAGDIAVDTSFLYVVVDNAGTLQWQRVAISTF